MPYGDTCRKGPFLGTVPASLWVGRPCGGCPTHLSGDATLLLLAAVCPGHGMELPPCCNRSVRPSTWAQPGHDVTRRLEAPNGAFVARDRLALKGLTLESHPTTKRCGRKFFFLKKKQPNVLPCVFAGSGVSTAPRLWPGAQWIVAAQGPSDSICCTA